MTYNYLYLVNRLCQKMNEVELDSSTFTSADGVYADFKAAINAAIQAIYRKQDNEWPFGWATTTFNTVIGQSEYNKAALAKTLDWDSFYIKRQPLAIYSLTQTAGVATATVLAGHQLETGDSVYITGADQTEYVGDFTVTVVTSTIFTFAVELGATTPATGSPVVYTPYSTKKLMWMDWDAYRKEGYLEHDTEMIRDNSFSKPEFVVRKADNNFIISPKPNRIYTIEYEYFTKPDKLVAYSDVPTIPEVYEEVLLSGAIVHGYLFRDNIEESDRATKTFEDGIIEMRRAEIPIPYYMRIVD